MGMARSFQDRQQLGSRVSDCEAYEFTSESLPKSENVTVT